MKTSNKKPDNRSGRESNEIDSILISPPARIIVLFGKRQTDFFISAGFLTLRLHTAFRLLPRPVDPNEWFCAGRVAAYSSGAVTDFHRLPYYPSP
jgi:hypothetical protein